jgi:hypothetical protein
MAHENLKFRVDINNTKDWQPIFGSQDYGTFYMVYIKFKSYRKFENEFNSIEHEYICDFKLQNYRGQITMGFGEYKTKIALPDGTRNTDNEISVYITIGVAPFTIREELSDVVFSLSKPLTDGMVLQTEFERELPPNCLFKPGSPERSTYLDPYSYVRDGEAYSEISMRKKGSSEPFPIPEGIGCFIGPCIPNRSTLFSD